MPNAEVAVDIRSGEIHAILGENGAGKSTLMRILYGMEVPDSGPIELEGDPDRAEVTAGSNKTRHRHGTSALHAGADLDCA